MKYVDPRGSVAEAPMEYSLRLADGPRRVALLSNAFADCAKFLDLVSLSLAVVAPELRCKIYEKATPVGAAPAGMIDEITPEADAVITAIGHCGSCTSGTVRDAIAFASRGVPAVALVTEKFWDEGAFVAAGAGMADIPRVRLPYPVAGTDDATLQSIANDYVPAILSALRAAP